MERVNVMLYIHIFKTAIVKVANSLEA